MTLFTWDQTPANNDDADSSINLRENQAPSTLNNSVRAIMAAVRKYWDDLSGNLVLGGTSTAYTVTTNQVFTSLVDGAHFRARMNATSGATPTLAVDGLTAKAIQSVSGTAVATGALLQHSIQFFTYDSSADAWIVGGTDALGAAALTAGAGLTGGGALASSPSVAVGAGTGIAVNADDVAVDKASAANVRAAASNKVVTTDIIETASALVALSDDTTVAVDWDAGINFSLTVAGSRTIGNPTNGQPGTWRTILVQGNNTTDRTLSFGNQYLGEVPTITDCDDGKWYLLAIYCVTTSHFVVSGKVAKQ
jgi:hypothetical protein